MHLQLSESEKTFVTEMVRTRIGEVRQEIHHAMVSTYKAKLKETEVLLKGLLEKLEAAPNAV